MQTSFYMIIIIPYIRLCVHISEPMALKLYRKFYAEIVAMFAMPGIAA
jgi:hypothetical protein